MVVSQYKPGTNTGLRTEARILACNQVLPKYNILAYYQLFDPPYTTIAAMHSQVYILLLASSTVLLSWY